MEHRGLRHPERLADTLAVAGQSTFCWASAELAAFEALLDRSEPVSVIWLSAPGGVGKTALMHAWAGLAQHAGFLIISIHAGTGVRSVEP
jgi:hypothetical protein